MNEIEIKFDLQSPQQKGNAIRIMVQSNIEKDLTYKFFVGSDGIWDTLKDFSENNEAKWNPDKEGKYIIMVQAKEESSNKAFDYISRVDYIIGKVEEKLITEITLDRDVLKVGEKLKLSVECSKLPVVYKYWIKEEDKWELLKDYSAENTLNFSVRTAGKQEVLIECRGLDSKNNYDDFGKVEFEVLPIEKLEITDFRCLTTELLTGSELVFQVETDHEDTRMVLYKFIKINSKGLATCIQDYSTKRIVSYTENDMGEYKLLCLAKDMYSPKEFDDRAIIGYNVKLYNPIVIQSFTSDLSSPQICESSVEFKALVKGGKNLLYRFIIDGNSSEDSGYIKENTYIWKSTRPGQYNIDLWVKDASFEGKYEASSKLEFFIDEQSKNAVKIQEVLLDREKDYVINETINVKVIAVGGVDLRYSFIVFKDGKEKEKVEYGTCNWVNFTPEKSGTYELEVRVKDKYSRKEYDSHSIIPFEVKDHLLAEIDFVLMSAKEYYMVGDTIGFDAIVRKTKDTRIKYILRINGHKVEETDYVDNKKYSFTPKCSGVYIVELLARNSKSISEFDSKKEIKITVNDAMPITNTKIKCDKTSININEPAIFSASCEGGKDVSYEFYLMEQDEWNRVQKYSKKNYYSFMPFIKGKYKLLALCKSEYKNSAYEDYDIMEFVVQ